MRKLIVLLWVFFLPIPSILAQSSDDNQEVYDQLKPWAVVKLTIAYMEDLYLFTPDKKGERGNNKEYKTYKKLYTNYSVFKEDINLDSISTLLKKGAWSGASENQFLEYKQELFERGYKNFKKILYTPTNTYEKFQIKKLNRDRALVQINQRFDSLTQQDNQATIVEDHDSSAKESQSTKNQTPIETPPSKNHNDNFYSTALKWVFPILLLISIYFHFNTYSKNKEQQKKYSTKRKELKRYKENYNEKETQLTISQNEIRNLKDENLRLKDNLGKIHKKAHEGNTISDKPSPSSDTISTPSVVAIPEIISETTELEVSKQHLTEIIYLSSPFQNLTFADEDASKEKTLDSLYLVEFDKQTQMGELSVIMDANFSKALNSPDFYLETACTYDNVYFNNAVGIQVTEKGEIKLDGKDWSVTKKVRIKFI